MCLNNKEQEKIGDVHCPTCRKEKCVYISNNKTSSYCDCENSKGCRNVLNLACTDQQQLNLLFDGDSTHCFARRASGAYEKEKQSPFLNKFLHQSQMSTPEFEPKRKKKHSTHSIIVSNLHWLIQLTKNSIPFFYHTLSV